ncbi:conserved exported hypothetical protein [Microbacterium sp. C448]|nr:conserved exported hypothetical protein [Microbacterium sp. C448]
MRVVPSRSLSVSKGARLGALLVAVLATGLALTACAPSDPRPGALPPGVSVELIQLRSDVIDRAAQVRLVNAGEDDLVITGLEIVDPRFEAPIVRDKRAQVASGRTLDIRIALPPVVCDADAEADAATIELEYEVNGRASIAEASIPDPLAFIPLLHQKECLRERLADVAVMSWSGFEPSDAPAPAHLTLEIAPSGGGGAALVETVETTPLLMFDAAGAAPFVVDAEIGGSGSPQQVRVPLVPLRCDPHAVMEDKRGTIFDATVEVDGVTGVVEVAASAEVKGEVLAWVADWCGFGG